MNLRLIEVFIPLEHKTKVEEGLRECEVADFWYDRISDKKVLVRALVPAGDSEKLIDILENEFQEVEGFRVIILPVEASVPRFEGEEVEEKQKKERISREELYTKISGSAGLSFNYILLIIFSSIIAAVGIIYSNIPMVVGAMIIAPFLLPSVALSFATISGDFSLAGRALKVTFIGILLALVFSAFVGMLFPLDITAPEIVSRTQVSMGDVIVSLLSGSVAVLSFTTAMITSVAGVMVAVALLPPLVVAGMMLGTGNIAGFAGALLLFFVNLIGINIAGVITFSAQKVRPRTVFDFTKAQLLTFLALFIWIIFFIIVLFFVLK